MSSQTKPENIISHRQNTSHGWTWISDAWQIFKKDPGVWIGIMFVTLILNGLLGLIPFLGDIAGTVLTPVFAAGVIYAAQQSYLDQNIEFTMMFEGFKARFSDLLILGLLYFGLIILALMPALLSLILSGESLESLQQLNLEDPSGYSEAILLKLSTSILIAMFFLIPAFMAYIFSPALVMLAGIKPAIALKLSFSAALKNILPFTWFSLVLIPLILIASLPLLLGLIVLIPVLMISSYTMFNDVFERVSETSEEQLS